jgi:hypothetical protein
VFADGFRFRLRRLRRFSGQAAQPILHESALASPAVLG